ncbi:hypothetical protein PN623_03325, partial [Parabacteroides distasonis]|nr:hypothetical protein [Parabacteroides distasonis]
MNYTATAYWSEKAQFRNSDPLGVGYNTPGIIRFPFEQMASVNSGMTLIRLNRDFPQKQMKGKGQFVGMDEDMTGTIRAL